MAPPLKLLTVVGARPQFIKAAALSHAIAASNTRNHAQIQETLLHTGQHYDHGMSEVFFEELGLDRSARNLGVGAGSHAEQTGRMMVGIERCATEMRPDMILAYGDTNSTLAAALVSAKSNIPFAHVEAGLRSRNRGMPEEINRIVADRLATMLFTGTNAARQNLADEGLGAGVYDVGDIMFDCVRLFRARADAHPPTFAALGLPPRGYALATVHRAENTDDPDRLRAIFAGLESVSRSLPVVLPLHPRTAATLPHDHAARRATGFHLIEPVSYLRMMALEQSARLILTDSGGMQKEAYFHRVPCVTLRNETEWVETVESGWNRLAAADPPAILSAAASMLAFDQESPHPDFYGDGHAADKVVDHLLRWRGTRA